MVILHDQSLLLDPGPLVGQLVPGKTWVGAKAADLGATGTPSGFAVGPALYEELVGSPTALLTELQNPGVTVTSFGATMYQGVRVEGYAVVLTQKEINDRLSQLPPSLRGEVPNTGVTEYVYVTTNGRVKAIVVPATFSSDGSSLSDDVSVDFSGWGQPVQISTPTLAQIVSWSQFKAVLAFTSKLP